MTVWPGELVVFFDSWHGLLRVVVVVGTAAYPSLVLLLKISGKRTLAKLNAFDLIVTVALGSTLAIVLLSRDVALVEGVVAFALLVGLLSVRSRRISEWVKSEPTPLVFKGRALEAAMQRERVMQDELLAALRGSGAAALEQVHAVVLETDGTLNVIQQTPSVPAKALMPVRGSGEASGSCSPG